ncbi:MAG: HDIG domain-containing protein [Patescibacteria group bacterium]|nr:HDIG domain-containing protein [Patescibacteria group bacterium]
MNDYKKRAFELLNTYIKNQGLVKHNLAAGALMRSLAHYYKEDDRADLWELAGLVHDLDWEMTQSEPTKHTEPAAEILKKEGFPPEVIEAVYRHNFHANHPAPETLMEKALYYAEEMTGLIVAAALILPSKKIADLTVESVMKRFKEKSFARGVDRGLLLEMEDKLGLKVEELIKIALPALRGIHEELGL